MIRRRRRRHPRRSGYNVTRRPGADAASPAARARDTLDGGAGTIGGRCGQRQQGDCGRRAHGAAGGGRRVLAAASFTPRRAEGWRSPARAWTEAQRNNTLDGKRRCHRRRGGAGDDLLRGNGGEIFCSATAAGTRSRAAHSFDTLRAAASATTHLPPVATWSRSVLARASTSSRAIGFDLRVARRRGRGLPDAFAARAGAGDPRNGNALDNAIAGGERYAARSAAGDQLLEATATHQLLGARGRQHRSGGPAGYKAQLRNRWRRSL